MTNEQLEDHVESLNLAEFKVDNQAAPAVVLAKICDIYQKSRPLLDKISDFFLLPKKWKQVIRAFMAALDNICPAPENV